MPVPAPTDTWSLVSGLRNRIFTAVSEAPAPSTTLLTTPFADVVDPEAEAGIVTPEIVKSNSVVDTKCGLETLLLRSETCASIVSKTPVA